MGPTEPPASSFPLAISALAALRSFTHFIGPFIVVRLIGDNALEVNLTGNFSRKHPVFLVSLCKKFDAGDAARLPDRPELPQPQPEILDDQPQYHVDRILDEQIRKTPKGRRRRENIVRWKGYSSAHDLWVPEADLVNARYELRQFHMARRTENRQRDSSLLEI
jgi:Chromo (CHRromatin Organisation MOdifier) domain